MDPFNNCCKHVDYNKLSYSFTAPGGIDITLLLNVDI